MPTPQVVGPAPSFKAVKPAPGQHPVAYWQHVLQQPGLTPQQRELAQGALNREQTARPDQLGTSFSLLDRFNQTQPTTQQSLSAPTPTFLPPPSLPPGVDAPTGSPAPRPYTGPEFPGIPLLEAPPPAPQGAPLPPGPYQQIPQPAPGWVPSADLQGWVPPDHPSAFTAAPGGPAPPPGAPLPPAPPPPPTYQAPPPAEGQDPVTYWQHQLAQPGLTPEQQLLAQQFLAQEQDYVGDNLAGVTLISYYGSPSGIEQFNGTGGAGGVPPPGGGPPPGGVPPPASFPPKPGGLIYEPGALPEITVQTPGAYQFQTQAPGTVGPFQFQTQPPEAPGAFNFQTTAPQGVGPFQFQTEAPSPFAPGQIPDIDFATYQPGRLTTQGPQAPGAQTFSSPFQTYQAGQVSQFRRPEQGNLESMERDVLGAFLGTDFLGDEQLAQMKEQQKDLLLQLQQQAEGRLGLDAAARGTTTSGELAAGRRRLEGDTSRSLTEAYRDLDITALTQNREARERALQLAEQVLTGQTGRERSIYEALLGGELAQEDLTQAGVASEQAGSRFGLESFRENATERARGFESALQAALFGREGELAQEALAKTGVESRQAGSRFARETALSNEDLRNQAFLNALERSRFGLTAEQAQAGEAGQAFQRDLARSEFGLTAEQTQAAEQNAAFQRALERSQLGLQAEQAQASEQGAAFQRDLARSEFGRDTEQLQAAEQGAEFTRGLDLQNAQVRRALDSEELQRIATESRGADFQRDVDNYFRQQGIELDQRDMQRLEDALQLQRELGFESLGVDRERIGESGRQFDLSHSLALLEFIENQRQFNVGSGIDLASLGLQASLGTTNSLFGF